MWTYTVLSCFYLKFCVFCDFPGGSDGKESPAMQEMQVRALSREYPLEKGIAPHFSILAWRVPRTEESLGYSPWDYKELDTVERLTPSRFTFIQKIMILHHEISKIHTVHLLNELSLSLHISHDTDEFWPKRNRMEISKKAMLWLFRRTEIEIWQKLPPFFCIPFSQDFFPFPSFP